MSKWQLQELNCQKYAVDDLLALRLYLALSLTMCFEVDKCCFCLDVETATRAIALVEATVAAPLVVRGLAELHVGALTAGMLLFISAW